MIIIFSDCRDMVNESLSRIEVNQFYYKYQSCLIDDYKIGHFIYARHKKHLTSLSLINVIYSTTNFPTQSFLNNKRPRLDGTKVIDR